MSKEKAVVLLSGGMDSCVSATIARQQYQSYFLHISYGQRTESRELLAFQQISAKLRAAKTYQVRANHLQLFAGSSLTDKNLAVRQDGIKEGIPLSYVPFRNANLLSIAASLAEVIAATKIFIGAVEEDSSGYPDCRQIFFNDFQQLINSGTKPETKIKIETPLINLTKAKIVQKGLEIDAPLELSWSCYQNEDLACGLCDSCRLRLKAFKEAGVKDSLKYRTIPEELKNG